MAAPPQDNNTLGRASLALGIASTALVFGIGFCALVGAQQGWITVAGLVLGLLGVCIFVAVMAALGG